MSVFTATPSWVVSATTNCLRRQLKELQHEARLGVPSARQGVRAIQAELDDRALQMEELDACLAR
jgi:hypothetical protein